MCFDGISDYHVVFAAHAVISNYVNARLVRKRHPGPQNNAIAVNEIRAFMPIHSDSVSKTMREIFVAGPKSSFGNYFSRRVVDRTALMADDSCGQSSILRAPDDFERMLQLIRRLTQHTHSCDVRLITLHSRSIIDHHAHSFSEHLFLTRTMRKR